MRFGLSEEQILLQDSVNRFLSDNVPLDRVRAYADGGDDNDIWQGLTELGIPALLVPEAQGGVELTPLDAAIVAESLGYSVTPAPFLGSAIMAPTAFAMAGGRDDELAALAAGELRVGIAFGEAVGRRIEAQVNVTNNKVSGSSLFAFDADADAYLIADQNKHLYLVQADASGLERAHLTTVDKSRRTVELTYSDVDAVLVSEFDGAVDRVIGSGLAELLVSIPDLTGRELALDLFDLSSRGATTCGRAKQMVEVQCLDRVVRADAVVGREF